jgi:hypothetical protein
MIPLRKEKFDQAGLVNTVMASLIGWTRAFQEVLCYAH